MGCVSSKEEDPPPQHTVKQISGPVSVRRETQTPKSAAGGQPAGNCDPGPSPKAEDMKALSEHHRARVMEEAGRLVVVKSPKPRTGEIIPKPRTGEILLRPRTAEIGQRPRTGDFAAKQRTGEIVVLDGERGKENHLFALPGSQSPLKNLPRKHQKKSPVSLTPDAETPGISKSEMEAFVSAVARDPLPVPEDIAVGKCGTVSFSNPLKSSSFRPDNLGESARFIPDSLGGSSRFNSQCVKNPAPKQKTFVSSWLLDLNLPQYAAAFEAAGYDEADTLANLSEADLAQIESFSCIHILPGHKKRLMLASARPLLGQPASSTPSPTEQVVFKNPLLQESRLTDFEPESANDGASSRATESQTSSPASVLPILVLPKHLRVKNQHFLDRSQTFPVAEGKPLPALQGPKREEDRLTFLGKEPRHSKQTNRKKGADAFANGGAWEHLSGTPREEKALQRRKSTESPRVVESSQQLVKFKAQGQGSESPAGDSRQQDRKANHTRAEIGSVNAERRAVLEALQEQVRAKVEELRLAQETGKRRLSGPVLYTVADKVRMQEVYDLQASVRHRVAELSGAA